MYSDVPNLASVFGYTNASWTLKADLVCEYVCRLLNHMDRTGIRQCTPRNSDPELQEEPWVTFSSGYIQRALAHQPKQGSKRPVEALPELRARSSEPALRRDPRQSHGVLEPRTREECEGERARPGADVTEQPHPEEPRGARRLEGWATNKVLVSTLRDAPFGRSSG